MRFEEKIREKVEVHVVDPDQAKLEGNEGYLFFEDGDIGDGEHMEYVPMGHVEDSIKVLVAEIQKIAVPKDVKQETRYVPLGKLLDLLGANKDE